MRPTFINEIFAQINTIRLSITQGLSLSHQVQHNMNIDKNAAAVASTSATTTTSITSSASSPSPQVDQQTLFPPFGRKQYLVSSTGDINFNLYPNVDLTTSSTVPVSPLQELLGCPILNDGVGFQYGRIVRKREESQSWDSSWGCEAESKPDDSSTQKWTYVEADELGLIDCWSLDGIKYHVPKNLLLQRCGYFALMNQKHPQLFEQLCKSDTGLTIFVTGDIFPQLLEVLLYGFVVKLHPAAIGLDRVRYMKLISCLAFYCVSYELVDPYVD